MTGREEEAKNYIPDKKPRKKKFMYDIYTKEEIDKMKDLIVIIYFKNISRLFNFKLQCRP